MSIYEFGEMLVAELIDFYGEDANVQLQKTVKNNDTEYLGIVVRLDNSIISPVIYINDLFKEYELGLTDMDKCIGYVVEQREKTEVDNNMEQIKKITDWEYVSKHIYPCLVSTEGNKELLKELVHRDFLDMSIIYKIKGNFIGKAGIECSVKLTNQQLEIMSLTEDSVYEAAIQNLSKDGYNVRSLSEVVSDAIGSDASEALESQSEEIKVLTNRSNTYGAAGILDNEFLKEKLGSDSFYIIPSSVHELLFLRPSSKYSLSDIKDMVKRVNNGYVAEEDVLSYSCYLYSNGEIFIAA